MLHARDWILQGAIRVVQIRRSLEAREPFGRRGVVVVVGMKLAAQLAKALLEILRVDGEPPRQAEEREVVAVPAQREEAAALRAEVLINGSTRAAVAALEDGKRADWNRFGSHG